MPHQLYIPNLSMGLFETALALLHDRAYPVYKKNIGRRHETIAICLRKRGGNWINQSSSTL